MAKKALFLAILSKAMQGEIFRTIFRFLNNWCD